MAEILVNVMAEEIRMALVDSQGQLVDYVLERQNKDHTANHIYKGVIRNVLPGMNACFVDIGTGHNAYLNLAKPKQTLILQKLHVGQSVMVQVVKEEMLGKGARVTADISLAGRCTVLMPFSSAVNISKKITDSKQRDRLSKLGQAYLDQGCGSIMRTAAAKASDEDIKGDLDYLWQTWQHISKRYKLAKPGTDLYADADFWFRLVRDFAGRSIDSIKVDDREGQSRLQDLLRRSSTTQHIEVEYHEGPEPIFKLYHLDEQLDSLINTEVDLPSGGSIRIDHTEALTVFDVNSARYTGQSSQVEDTALAVNKEAAVEICRQLRLRDIGGIIVCDFIDMRKKASQEELLEVLRQQSKKDRMKTVVCGITQLGLVEMTRKRARQGLQSVVFETCSQCGGTGFVLSGQSVYIQILRRLRELKAQGRLRTDVEVTMNPQVLPYFTKQVLSSLEDQLGRSIQVQEDPTMSPEGYSILSLHS